MKIKSYLILGLLISFFPLTLFANDVYYYHTDNFGTPMVMTDAAGEVVWRSDELPFGEEYETIENPIKNNRRYLGKELDEESGLIYMGARFFDPGTGRFNRPDPVGLVDPSTGKVNQEMLLNPQRQNRYVYGLNNPYRYIDPDGNTPWDVVDAGFFALSVKNFASNPGWGTGAELAADTISLAPLVPSIGWITKADDAASLLKLNKKLASQEQMGQLNDGLGKAIAGAGTKTKLRDAPRLANQHGGSASDWAKVKSSSKTHSDGYKQRTHAYENKKLNKVVEHKTKIKD